MRSAEGLSCLIASFLPLFLWYISYLAIFAIKQAAWLTFLSREAQEVEEEDEEEEGDEQVEDEESKVVAAAALENSKESDAARRQRELIEKEK